MFRLRSLTGFTISVLIHGSVGAYFLTHNFKDNKPKPEKLVMQMAMFKSAATLAVNIKKPVVKTPPPKPVDKVAELKPAISSLTKKTPTEKIVKLETPKPILIKPPKIEAKPKPVTKKKVAVIKSIPKPPIKVKPKLKKKVKKKVKFKKKKKILKRKTVIAKKKPKIKPRKVRPPKRKVVVKRRVIKKPHHVRRAKAPSHRPAPIKATPKRVVHHTKPQQRAVTQNHGRPKARQASKTPHRVVRAKPATRPATQPRVVSNPHLERQYEQSIRQRIEQKKVYPRHAKRMRKQGVVKVAFTINRNGIVSKLRIVQSSGVKSLDRAALKAVKKVGRFPAIPSGIRKQFLSYIIPISYRIR